MNSQRKTWHITKGQIGVIKIAQAHLGISDDDYREMLQERYGVQSCTLLSFSQAGHLIDELKSKGFEFTGKCRDAKSCVSTRRAGDEPQDKNIRATWLTLYDCGIIRDPAERAMLAFVKRITGKDALPWCSTQDKARVIEALKKMGERPSTSLRGREQ